MQKESQDNFTSDLRESTNFAQPVLVKSIDETSKYLVKLTAQDQLQWAHKKFDEKFVLTTSFGIQSAVLLHMTLALNTRKKPKIIWIDTGYLPQETYNYAEELTKLFELDLIINSPSKPRDINWIPIIINNIPKKKTGLLPIGTPLNQPIVRYKLIPIPDIKLIIPNNPKKCNGLTKYLPKNNIVSKSKNP